jgi:hypothetical protein
LANQLLTISMITREMLRVLVNNLVFADKIDRQYDDQFAKTGAKIGNTLNIRKPARFVRTDGQGLQLQDVTETTVPLVLTTQGQRAFTFTSQDLTLSIDDYSKRFINPAVASLANQVDYDGLQLYKQVWNLVGSPGTVPNAVLTYLTAGVYLDNNATPMDGERSLCINPLMQATIVNALTGFYNPQVTISEQYKKGQMSKDTLGFDWYMDQNVGLQTIGTYAGSTPNVKTAPVSGATSLSVQGWTAADVLNVGDVFTLGFASYGGAARTTPVYSVNPQNFQSTGVAQQFVVTAPFLADGSGNGTLYFSPAITTSGPFQTVNQLPTTGTTNGLINVYGASATNTPQGLAFHRDAFTMASADLPLPGGVDMAERVSDKELGISIRAVRAYDINQDRFPLRLDFLYGYAATYPQLAVRIAS